MHIRFIQNGFKVFIVTGIVVFGLLTSVYAGADKPAVIAESGSYDFGIVFEGSKVIHDFILKNTGTVHFEIQNVKSG
jgi:hypothetical protein